MIAFESHARWLLVLHAFLGSAVVAVSTHLLFWMRHYPKARYGRHQAVRWFAAVGLGLYAAQFLLGNVLYPTYKVRVRVEYFDLASAVAADGNLRREARAQVDPGTPVGPAPRTLANLSRTFDIKEHWAALGLALAAATCLLAWTWDPKRDGPGGAKLLFGLAAGAAASAWIAAVIGFLVTSYRAVGSL